MQLYVRILVNFVFYLIDYVLRLQLLRLLLHLNLKLVRDNYMNLHNHFA